MIKLPSLQNLNVRGKAVITRVDFNIPYQAESVKNDYRVKRALPTIEYLIERGARVILITHLEKDRETPSLDVISKGIRKYFLPKLKFIPDLDGSLAKHNVSAMQPGDVILLENLRRTSGEVSNSENFAKSLASLGDLYVNEAFGVSHRRHASIVGLPKFLLPCAGLLFQEEISRLSEVFNPKKPFLFILGGKKIATKAKLIEKFLEKADFIFIGGAVANVFLKSKKYSIGSSYFEEEALEVIQNFVFSERILLPKDVVVKRGGRKKIVGRADIKKLDVIYDSGPATLKELREKIKRSKFILWNGPIGYVEGGFKDGTRSLARMLGKAKAEVIVGGGSTVAFLQQEKLLPAYSFVSTGGGAMLEFLAEGTLPGIEAMLKNQPRR